MVEAYMKRAIELAYLGKGDTYPNPPVGAVVVDSTGRIIGEGFHPKAGFSHAEVFAIEAAKKSLDDLSTCQLYVTLEPCRHFGRTPPCTDLILKEKIKTVFVGSTDPNPVMQGKSIALLKNAGVNVTEGVLKSECEKIIRGFEKILKLGRPFVTLKTAVSLDGKVATSAGESKWITSEESRARGHLERKQHDGILVGIETLLADNPGLDVRYGLDGKPKTKVVLDSRLRTPLNSQIFKTPGRVVIFTSYLNDEKIQINLEKNGALVIPVESPNGRLSLHEILGNLVQLGVQDLLVEGGGQVLGSFIQSGLFDRLVYFMSPQILGDQALDSFRGLQIPKLSDAVRFTSMTATPIGVDLLIEGNL